MGLKERKSGVKLVSALPPLLKQQSPLSSIKQHSAEASHTDYMLISAFFETVELVYQITIDTHLEMARLRMVALSPG